MESCPRCNELIEEGWAYCPVCGRSRILESLRRPSPPSRWRREVLSGLILGLSLWLVVTVAVAFFREAKAVRDSARLFNEGKPQEAWTALDGFVQSHPRHEKALALCAAINVHLGNATKADECLREIPGQAKEVAEQIGPLLMQQAEASVCTGSAYSAWFELAEKLGEESVQQVEGILPGALSQCGSLAPLGEITALYLRKNRAPELIQKVYVPLVKQQENTWAARQIAHQLAQMLPDAEAELDRALKP